MSSSLVDLTPFQLVFGIAYCIVSTTALVLYDTFVTFSYEIHHIWLRKWTLVTSIFLVSRYCAILQVLSEAAIQFAPQISSPACDVLERIEEISSDLVFAAAAAFSALRIYAIWERSLPLAVLIFAVMFVPVVTNIYRMTIIYLDHIEPAPVPFGGCVFGSRLEPDTEARWAAATRAAAMAGDALVLFGTWFKTYKIKTAAKRLGITTKLVDLLLQDGTLYFAAQLTINLLQLLINQTNHGPFWNLVSYYNAPLTSILTTRFLLHLRHVDTISLNDTEFQSNVSFANGPHIGNIGAPLSYSSMDSEAADTIELKLVRLGTGQPGSTV